MATWRAEAFFKVITLHKPASHSILSIFFYNQQNVSFSCQVHRLCDKSPWYILHKLSVAKLFISIILCTSCMAVITTCCTDSSIAIIRWMYSCFSVQFTAHPRISCSSRPNSPWSLCSPIKQMTAIFRHDSMLYKKHIKKLFIKCKVISLLVQSTNLTPSKFIFSLKVEPLWYLNLKSLRWPSLSYNFIRIKSTTQNESDHQPSRQFCFLIPSQDTNTF